MNKRELLEAIKDLPDDAIVLKTGGDHSLVPAIVTFTSALQEDRRQWTEDHGEELTPEAQYGKRVPAIVID